MHSIRLRQPWEEIAAASGQPALRRRFNKPTGLDAWERVTLEIDRIVHAGSISLNGTALGKFKSNELFTADITALLLAANELHVELDSEAPIATSPVSHSVYIVAADEPLGSPFGDVRLIIQTVQPQG